MSKIYCLAETFLNANSATQAEEADHVCWFISLKMNTWAFHAHQT